MSRRTSVAVLALAVGALLPAVPASAINSYNSSPAPQRTNVGALLVDADRDGDGVNDGPRFSCSGTMIDHDTFLTAGHCIGNRPAGARFFVTLAQQLTAAAIASAVEGTGVAMPGFALQTSDWHDLAVVELGQRAGQLPAFAPAALPTQGLLDRLGNKRLADQPWIVAGYGTQEAVRGTGGAVHPPTGERRQAPLTFHALNPTWVRLGMTAAQGNGGACYGDSGGPNFTTVAGREVLVATTSTGDVPCYATNVAYRLDTPGARAFLAPYARLP